ncbi:hypothetical protein, partial [Megasphaera massiliensis]|uniref:hypothetical protein n=1 Tax=Megasphaera massiliensis TaxID=1232428 RepID=UPI001D05CFA0
DGIHPCVLYLGPSAVHVVPAFVLHRHQSVVLHPAGEELLAVLGHSRLEDEYACGDADAEEQILRKVDDLQKTM